MDSDGSAIAVRSPMTITKKPSAIAEGFFVTRFRPELSGMPCNGIPDGWRLFLFDTDDFVAADGFEVEEDQQVDQCHASRDC